MKKLFVFLPILYLFTTCAPKTRQPENLPAPGFNVANSDAKAIAIADEVMLAMGGRQAWDDTGFLSWNFFDRRKLMWDKKTGICQIVWSTRPLSVIVNLNNGTGRVSIGGVEQTHPDSLSK
nr:hypothetical protein [Saprospiraceae bacterium]